LKNIVNSFYRAVVFIGFVAIYGAIKNQVAPAAKPGRCYAATRPGIKPCPSDEKRNCVAVILARFRGGRPWIKKHSGVDGG